MAELGKRLMDALRELSTLWEADQQQQLEKQVGILTGVVAEI